MESTGPEQSPKLPKTFIDVRATGNQKRADGGVGSNTNVEPPSPRSRAPHKRVDQGGLDRVFAELHPGGSV